MILINEGLGGSRRGYDRAMDARPETRVMLFRRGEPRSMSVGRRKPVALAAGVLATWRAGVMTIAERSAVGAAREP